MLAPCPDRTTVILYPEADAALETELRREFAGLAEVRREARPGGAAGIGAVHDRRGRLVARCSDASAIRAAVAKAAQVMRLDWPDDDDPRFAQATEALAGRRPMPGILRSMSFQPEWLGLVSVLSQKAHFADGALDRRTKEMIATYVSALNECRY